MSATAYRMAKLALASIIVGALSLLTGRMLASHEVAVGQTQMGEHLVVSAQVGIDIDRSVRGQAHEHNASATEC